jgi:hypothetical protein
VSNTKFSLSLAKRLVPENQPLSSIVRDRYPPASKTRKSIALALPDVEEGPTQPALPERQFLN